MSSFKPIDGSKEDFRKYLDRQGVLDAITKVLIKCNSDRPENAIQYLLDNLGERLKDKDTIARLESELNDARNEIEILKQEINALNLHVANDTGSDTTVSQANDSPLPANADLANQQDAKKQYSTEAAIPSNNGTTDPGTIKSTGFSETVAAAKAESAESDPNESTGQ